MKKIQQAAFGLALAGSVFAANAQVTCNGSTQCSGPAAEMIEGLFPRASGGVLLEASAVVSGLPCTGSSGGPNLLLPGTHGNYNQTYATLLTASVADKDLVLRIDTNESSCTLLYARMVN